MFEFNSKINIISIFVNKYSTKQTFQKFELMQKYQNISNIFAFTVLLKPIQHFLPLTANLAPNID